MAVVFVISTIGLQFIPVPAENPAQTHFRFVSNLALKVGSLLISSVFFAYDCSVGMKSAYQLMTQA
jgi:hypothetical protein